MLQISNLNLSLDGGMAELRQKAAKALGLSERDLPQLTLHRQSVDARKKSDVRYVCTVRCALRDEKAVLKRCGDKVSLVTDVPYVFPPVRRTSKLRPVVVGMGPAGLFAALFLARAGIPCTLLERGRPVEERTRDVAALWSAGALDSASNVQFGEGGAGAFSDGKLQTGIHDPRVRTVLETFVEMGAPADILYVNKPHVGTDLLRDVLKNLRAELLRLGCEIRFSTTFTDVDIQNGAVGAVTALGPEGAFSLPCDALILAPGHSARDTFAMLRDKGVAMEPKAFAVGVRVEHDQAAVSAAQYGAQAAQKLPAADYKLACHLPNGRGVFSFCVCPGGQVVCSSSEDGSVVTNGMSYRARDGKNINGGLLVGVSPEDFAGADPLAGFAFQARWEQLAFQLGGGGFAAPGQNMKSFLTGSAPSLESPLTPTYRPGVVPADLAGCLPGFITDSLKQAIPALGKKLRGFDDGGALLTGVETRSSSPVRLARDGSFQSPLRGLYPCGEGAGWAGGITSAAADGIKVAEAVASV